MEIFIEGPVSPQLIADTIADFQAENQVGAQNIFLGQIRADHVDGKHVTAIAYTAYTEMVSHKMEEIKTKVFELFDIHDFRILHSLGKISVGEICLFILTTASHRKDAIAATNYILEAIKKELPIFGKELFEDDSHQWKVNRF